MIGKWLGNLGDLRAEPGGASELTLDTERLSAHLLVEVARADFGIDVTELDAIRQAIKRSSGLDPTEIDSIVDEACSEVENSVSYRQHIKVINDTFSSNQKSLLVEQMWRVAYADEHLDRYEEAFIRRISDLIYVKHKDFMQAKHRAQPT